MDQLVELLQQIQDLAGVGIEALQAAAGGGESKRGAPSVPPAGPEGGPPEPPEEEWDSAPPEPADPSPRAPVPEKPELASKKEQDDEFLDQIAEGPGEADHRKPLDIAGELVEKHLGGQRLR